MYIRADLYCLPFAFRVNFLIAMSLLIRALYLTVRNVRFSWRYFDTFLVVFVSISLLAIWVSERL